MRQYDDINQGLKSLNNKIQLPEREQQMVLTEINEKMDRYKMKKHSPIPWRYYLASAATLLLIIIIAVPFLNNQNQNLVQDNAPNLVQGPTENDPIVNETTEEEITFHMMNYTHYFFNQMVIKVYRNGELKTSQGVSIADDFAKPGDIIDFNFFDYEMGQGQIELEIEIQDPASTEASKPVYTTPKMSLIIDDEREYFLKLYAESKTSYYIAEDENKFELNINNDFVEMVREKVGDLGLTKGQVKSLLGTDYEKIDIDGNETWQFDFGAVDGYKSPSDGFYDKKDLEEIKSGSVQAILRLHWNKENKLKQLNALYLDKKDGNVYAYYVFADGREKVTFVY